LTDAWIKEFGHTIPKRTGSGWDTAFGDPVKTVQHVFKALTGQDKPTETQRRDFAWRQITMRPDEIKAFDFQQLPPKTQFNVAASDAFAKVGLGWYELGRKVVPSAPDISSRYLDYSPVPSEIRGVLGGTISHLTSDYDYGKVQEEYPYATAGAAAGELTGIATASKAIGYAAKAPVAVTKTAYAHLPATVKHTMHMKWAAAKFEVAKHVAPTIKKIQLHRPTLHTKYLDYTHGHKTFVDVYADEGLYSAMPKTGMAAESAKISYAGTKVLVLSCNHLFIDLRLVGLIGLQKN